MSEKDCDYNTNSVKATDYGIKYTNVAKNSFEQFGKTKEGGVFLKGKLEQLGRCVTKKEMDDLIAQLQKKYPNQTTEIRKLQEVAENVRKEC